VYLFGQQGDRASVKRALADGDTTSATTLGVVAASIATASDGPVVTQGYVYGLNLSGYTPGNIVYLSPTVAGGITQTKPHAPSHLVYVGVVVRANAGDGILYVRAQNGYELDELHNVQAQSPTNGDTIKFDSSDNQWKKQPDIPTGSVQMFAGSTAPVNWLMCDGSAVSRTTYAALFALIGTTYGVGNGSTTFNLPDMRSRMPVGVGQGSGFTNRTLGATGGAESVTLTDAQSGLVGHTHGNTLSATTGTESTSHTHDISHGHTASSALSGTLDHTHGAGTLFANGRQSASATHGHTGTTTAATAASNAGATNYSIAIGGSTGSPASLAHSHGVTVDGFSGSSGADSSDHSHAVTISGGVSSVTGANASASHENMTPFLSLNFIIRT